VHTRLEMLATRVVRKLVRNNAFREDVMLFIVRWTIPHVSRKAAIQRFMETGGAPPAGVKMLARYHSTDGEFGFAIAESDDAQALARWTNAWNDLLPMDTRPVVDDQGLAAVLQSP
jgi:Protein of unknown function (DUF3303)